jgi:hypothetical protein
MRRRRFLQVAAAGALAIGLPGARAGTSRPFHLLADPGLLRLFGSTGHVRAIGVRYRAAFPHEDTPETLAAAILVGRDRTAPTAPLPAARLHDHLERQVRDDFARGATVRLDGWILSRTEARQCALYSMLHP